MIFIRQIERLQKLNKLIEQERTGTPDEFATRLGIKQSMLFELLDYVRSFGLEISYDRKNRTYYYKSPKKLIIKLKLQVLDPTETNEISGGITKFFPASIFIGPNQNIFTLNE